MRRIWAVGLTAIAMLLPIGVSRADGPTEEPVVTAESLGNAAAEARRFLAKYQSGPATFFVELSGQPLALVEAAAKKTTGDPEAHLTDAQIAEVKANLQAEQAEVVRFVEANGGTVHGQLFWAINAVRVTLEGAHVPRVRELPGVKKLHELPYSRRSSASSVPAVGAPAVWGGDGKYTGKGIKVAVLDSGIDYTHATFGGEGTLEAFQAAAKTADPTPYFASTRVKGGTDLVGDAYDGTDATRRPDANPIDCYDDGHGTHVAATIGGTGVLATGKTYDGPFDEKTHSYEFKVAPGTAPEAELYAVRIFGCTGVTTHSTEAIDWALENRMDVANLSFASVDGRETDPDAVAAANAVANGVVIVAAAGSGAKRGSSRYYGASSPAMAPGVASVAAVDDRERLSKVEIVYTDLSDYQDARTSYYEALNHSGVKVPEKASMTTLKGGSYETIYGCKPEDYAQVKTGDFVVVKSEQCSAATRAVLAQQAGASGILITYSPFETLEEGNLTKSPIDGSILDGITIPVLSVNSTIAQSSFDELNGDELRMKAASKMNHEYRAYAPDSAPGPRFGDVALRPTVSAPGVNVESASAGTGIRSERRSGTSIAAAHASGAAALTLQAHPSWTADEVTASLANTSNTENVTGYKPLNGGGLLDVGAATTTEVLAFGDRAELADGLTLKDPVLSFGFAQVRDQWEGVRTITLKNTGTTDATYRTSVVHSEGSIEAEVTLNHDSVTVRAGATAEVQVNLKLSRSDVEQVIDLKSPSYDPFLAASGTISFTSDHTDLKVPFLLAVDTLDNNTATSVPVAWNLGLVSWRNSGPRTVDGSLCRWSLTDLQDVDPASASGVDIADVCVRFQYLSQDYTDIFIWTYMHTPVTNDQRNELWVLIDNNLDGKADYASSSAFEEPEAIDAPPTPREHLGRFIGVPRPRTAVVKSELLASEVGVTGKFAFTVVSTAGRGPLATADFVGGWSIADYENPILAAGGLESTLPGNTTTWDVSINSEAVEAQQPFGYLFTDGGEGTLTGPLRYMGPEIPVPTPQPED